jgi:hypothetical protein
VRLALSEQGANLLTQAPRPARGLLPEALRQLNAEQVTRLNEGLRALLDSIGLVDEGYGLEPLSFNM